SRRRHTRSYGDWSSDVCSSDLGTSLHEPSRGAHGGVRHREVWMNPESAAAGRQPGFRHFHDQLEELKQRLLRMCERAESLVDLEIGRASCRERGWNGEV